MAKIWGRRSFCRVRLPLWNCSYFFFAAFFTAFFATAFFGAAFFTAFFVAIVVILPMFTL
jgi:hypothetical protein